MKKHRFEINLTSKGHLCYGHTIRLGATVLHQNNFLRRAEVARRKLRMLHNAQKIENLRIPPNNRLEALNGVRTGQWSARIND